MLVDGPASVIVPSGRVEVFGSTMGSANKVVIREGKRLPFTVEETAAFDISLGESASAEEVDGTTIPQSWTKAIEELLRIQTRPVTALVLGTVDSGKTSFCTFLMNRLLHEKRKAAILDGDLGQSDVGPPGTVAYTFVTKPITDLFNLQAKNAFFIGATSPSVDVNKVIKGLTSLKEEIASSNPDFIIINTDGWIEGEDATNYKVQLIRELKPDIVFGIQQKDELTSFLNILEGLTTAVVESSSAIKQRNREKRKNLRELGYVKYLRAAKVQSFPLSWLKIEENEMFGLNRTHENTRQARKIYDLLEMKPLHLAEFKDRITIVIGRSRWIKEENLKRVEEFAKKKIMLIRKGEEEGLLTALYNDERKFLGIGVLQEVEYSRKTIKIFSSVSKGIAIVALGKVKLDKNLKELPTFDEESQSDLSTIRKLF